MKYIVIEGDIVNGVEFAGPFETEQAAEDYGERFLVYPVHAKTRKSFGEMTRKLSVTESHIWAQFRRTVSRRKSSVAAAN
jgi:hypothetical protein